MMQLRCPCERILGYELRHLGKQVRCPGCQRLHIVPDPAVPGDAPEAAIVEQPESGVAPRRQGLFTPALLQTLGELLYSGPALAIMLLLSAIGIGLLIYWNSEGKVSGRATELPRSVTCRQLIDEGPGENPHVRVTEVIAGQNYFTRVKVTKVEQASGDVSNKPWEVVYLPLLPLTPELKTRLARGEPFIPPPAHLVRLILISHKIRNKEELAQVFSPEGTIQGLIVNSISSMGSETENMLRQKYPGLEVDKVLLLDPCRKPTSRALRMALFVSGIGLIVLAGMLAVVSVTLRPKR